MNVELKDVANESNKIPSDLNKCSQQYLLNRRELVFTLSLRGVENRLI